MNSITESLLKIVSDWKGCLLYTSEKTVFGGECEENGLRIEPTVMDNVKWNDAVMQEEIFGPVLPILTFKNIGEAVKKINSMAHPLALYIFSENKRNIKYVTERCTFGGGCVNAVSYTHLRCAYDSKISGAYRRPCD